MKLPFLEFVKRRFHYELDKAQEEYNRALGRMEDGEFERGFIAGLERGLYIIEDSKRLWGNNPLDMDDLEGDSGGSGSSEGEGSSGDSGEGTGSGSGESSSGSGSGSGAGSGSSGEGDNPDIDMPLDAMTQ